MTRANVVFVYVIQVKRLSFVWWKLHLCWSGTIWQYFWYDFWFYFLRSWIVSHGWPIYCSVSLVSFWCLFANQRTCSKSISTSLKSSLKFFWRDTLRSQLILKSTITCLKFVLVETFIVVLDKTSIDIYIWQNTSP